jgi:hypothetical protein
MSKIPHRGPYAGESFGSKEEMVRKSGASKQNGEADVEQKTKQ